MSKTSSAFAPTPADSPTSSKAPDVAPETPAKPEPGAAPSAATELQVPTPTDAKAFIDDEEPQNLLTKKFTEEEWKALKELRVRSCIPQRYLSLLTCLCGTETNPYDPHQGLF
jgi:hypothetical protein